MNTKIAAFSGKSPQSTKHQKLRLLQPEFLIATSQQFFAIVVGIFQFLVENFEALIIDIVHIFIIHEKPRSKSTSVFWL